MKTLLTRFQDLPAWLMIIMIVYAIYFFVRAYYVWDYTREDIRKGYRRLFFGRGRDVRVYHIIRIVFDIPPAIVGLIFPLVRKLFALKIYTFKEDKKLTPQEVLEQQRHNQA